MSLTSYLAAPSRDFIQVTLVGAARIYHRMRDTSRPFLKKMHLFFI